MIIPSSSIFDQSTLTALLEYDPVVQDYHAFFALLDWSVVEQWQAQQSAYRGTHGHPISAYLKAFLIRIREKMIYATELRSFLLHHPLLILELGFSLYTQPFNEGDVTYYRPLYQIERGGQMRLSLDRESPLWVKSEQFQNKYFLDTNNKVENTTVFATQLHR